MTKKKSLQKVTDIAKFETIKEADEVYNKILDRFVTEI